MTNAPSGLNGWLFSARTATNGGMRLTILCIDAPA
jgi:hypothetical protein